MNNITLHFKRYYLIAISLLVVSIASAQKLQKYENGVLKGLIKVKLKPELIVSPQGLKSSSVSGQLQVGILSIDRLNKEAKATKMERIFPYSPKFETRHQKHGLHLWYRIEVDENEDVRSLIQTYSQIDEVEIAEPYYEKELVPYSLTMMENTTTAALKSTTPPPFNDPILADQWHYHNTGEGDVTTGADINLYKAWEKQAGQPHVIVSVHDEGIQYDHEDLLANMWVNEAELNGSEGVDDDGNGYADDIYGYSFASSDGQIIPDHHGTHVAGTVAAVNNNGIGVSGVAGGTGFGDGVRIMACQILGGDQYPDIEASYVYAADMGAVISQNSWGWSVDGEYEQSVLDAIDYFIAEAGNYSGSPMKGGIAIFASGNNGSQGLHYPAAYENTIAVGATGPENLMTDYSNYGEYIDITAPGGDNGYGEEFGVLSTVNHDGYAYLDGTSMACPHVSGVAALIVSEYGGDDFTNDDLKVHLLGGTNVIDTLAGNTNRVGMMGLGGTDAELALRTNNGIPPAVISDLTLSGISQDFANLKWTVPVDEDDDNASFFEIYYASEAFDESTIGKAKKRLIKNKSNAGTTFEYELSGLEALTTYHFALKGLDRWGNTSELSNSITGRTNAGPEVQFSVPEVTFNIDVNTSKQVSGSFELQNIGEGVLKWEVFDRHIRNVDTYINSLNYPAASSVRKMPEIQSAPLISNSASIMPFAQKPVENDDLFYFHPDYLSTSMVTIGETDLHFTNSMAVKFDITREQGFNMTHFEFALNLPNIPDTPLDGPIILELYEGNDLNSAKRIYAQEYMPEEATIWHFVEMTEQVFFESGESFFMVVHIPANNRYPLVASYGYHSSFADYMFYSINLGQEWVYLKDVFSPDYVWDVAAWSRYEPLDTYVKLSPNQGVVNSDGSQTIQVDLDASKLINGEYNAKLSFVSNESGKELNYLPLNFTVSGNLPKLESDNVLEFGNVFVGESKAITIDIHNIGLGAFGGDDFNRINVEVSNNVFQLSSNAPNTIPAERSHQLEFRFWPQVAGVNNATVTLTDTNGQSYKFNLFGVGINPPVATVEPAEASFNNLALGDVVHGSFTLRNDGEYPLKYYVPKFADGTNLGENTTGLVHTFGYAGGQVEGDASTNAFNWQDISGTGTEVSAEFKTSSYTRFIDVEMGFEFPFFEGKEDTVYITKQGALCFTTDGWFNSQPLMFGNHTQPSKLISAYGLEMDFVKGGQIYYQTFPDRVIVQYNQIPANYLDNWVLKFTEVTFQIVLISNGDIEIYYKDMGTIPYGETILGHRTTMQVSIFAESLNDGLLLNGFISPDQREEGGFDGGMVTNRPPTTGYMMYFRYPGFGSIQSVSNPFGTLQVGESVALDYTIDTKDLYVGDFVERINIISNDPVNNPATHNINLNITSGGEANYTQNMDAIDFGDVFQREQKSIAFSITNEGRAIGGINSINFLNNHYTAEGYLPIELKPNSKVEYTITIQSNELGNKDDVLTFTDNQGLTHQVDIKGNVIDAPIIGSATTELNYTIAHGQLETVDFTIDNTGNNPMKVSPVGNEWLQITEKAYTGQSPMVDYAITFESNPSSPYNNWIDIRETGKQLADGDMFEKADFWRKEALPFDFNFYGQSYDTIYISFNGLIMFDKMDEALSFGPQQLIPHTEAPNNFIAPLWAPQGPAWKEVYPTSGTYYQVYDDKVVIQFQEFENLFSMGHPVSFEVILYKNGNIKYLYHFPYEEFTTKYSVVGIENADGTEGHAPSQFSHGLIKDGSVITFVPIEKYTVAANSSKTFDITFDARSIYGGSYQEYLVFKNNTPDAPDYALPVYLIVQGEKQLIAQDTLDLGEVFIYDEITEENTSKAKVYDVAFTLSSEGTEKIQVSRMRLQDRASGLTVMGDQNKYGTPGVDDPWVDISRKNLNQLMKPGYKETFNLRVAPASVEAITDTILVYCDLEDGLFKIPVSALYTAPPVVNIQSEGIELFANTEDDTFERTVNIDNAAGGAKLIYRVDFEFERGQTETVSVKSASIQNNKAKAELQTLALPQLKALHTDGLVRDDYNRILENDAETTPAGMIGFGGGYRFYSATAFTAPEDGFNLTHAINWIGWGGTLNYDIEVAVYGGANQLQNAQLLHSEQFSISETEENINGEIKVFELSKNLLFYPNEKFFILFKFDKNLEYPQASIDVKTPVSHRYYFGNDDAIFEVVENDYETMGWLMKAAEKDYASNIWASLDSHLSDTIKVDGEQTLNLSFIAKYAEQGINVANMVVYSNDPLTPAARLPIALHRNKGPQYNHGNNIYYAINEGDTLRHTVIAHDDEGDDFTLQLKKDYEYVSTTINQNEMELVFASDYEAAGVHQIIIEGTDAYGNESEFVIDIAVTNVNREPQIINPLGDQFLLLENQQGFEINMHNHIEDPDGDALSFEFEWNNEEVLETFITNSGLIMKPVNIGSGTVQVKATDVHGAQMKTSFNVFVEHRVGIDDSEAAQLLLYPNPAIEEINIELENKLNKEALVKISNADGRVIKTVTSSFNGTKLSINIANLSPGLYFIEVSNGESSTTQKFTKR